MYTLIYDRNTNINRQRHPSERLCTLCNTGLCEDEIHFLLVCPLYKDLRYMLLDPSSQNNHDFSSMSNFEKMLFLMQFHQYEVIL